TVLHWSGSKWSPVSVNAPTPIDLHAVWSAGANTALAVGSGGAILQCSSSPSSCSYSSVAGGTVPTFRAIWGSSADAVWAVAETGSGTSISGAVFHRTTALGWTEVPVPSGTPGLTGVWTSDPNHVWIVRTGGTLLTWSNGPLKQSTVGSPALTIPFRGVWGSSPSNVWVAGDGRVAHWD